MKVAVAALIALAIPLGVAAAKPAAKPTAARDWTRTYSVTPSGGFRMGNPAAKVAIVEYGSLTCPHCRHFAETAMKPLLQNYVRTGKASYEYRSLVLNGVDLAAALVARCQGPSHFFPIAANLYATQPIWIGRFEGLSDDDKQKLLALPTNEMTLRVGKISGLIPVASANGIPPARAEACLKDNAASFKLAQMHQVAIDSGIRGTPTFFVNGKEVAANDWATLEPFLKGAGG